MQQHFRTRRSRGAAIGLAVAALVLSLTACSAAEPEDSAAAHADHTEHAEQSSAAASAPVVIREAWAKASDPEAAPGEGMTGVFGELENSSDEDLTIAKVSSDAADMVEMHEVVDGKMRAIQGDVVIPAGGSLLLEPGANHIMLMGLTTELLPGDEVEITIEFTDGTAFSFPALVKDTSGANESYEDVEHDHSEHSDHSEHDSGGHDPDGH